MREIDFDPKTMTMATSDDFKRMWVRLWGTDKVLFVVAGDFVEMLDITQKLLPQDVSTSDYQTGE